jgi:heme A synthase
MSNAVAQHSDACCQEQTGYCIGLNYLARFVAVWAFVVVLLGGTTKSKEAGLTIPEPFIMKWIPEWFHVANLNAEYTHRVSVGILSISALLLMGWILAKDTRKAVRRLAVGLIGAILAQAVIGAMTVYFLAHAPTSIPHAVLGQTVFALACCLAIMTSRKWIQPRQPVVTTERPTLRRYTVLLLAAMYVQLLLGGALRHDDKGEVLRNGHTYIFVWHLIAHIAGAMTVTYFLARVLMRVFRQHREQAELMKPAKILMMLLTFQLLLGVGAAACKILYASYEESNSPPEIRVWTATAHVAVGALMLATCFVLSINAFRSTMPGVVRKTEQAGDQSVMGVPA